MTNPSYRCSKKLSFWPVVTRMPSSPRSSGKLTHQLTHQTIPEGIHIQKKSITSHSHCVVKYSLLLGFYSAFASLLSSYSLFPITASLQFPQSSSRRNIELSPQPLYIPTTTAAGHRNNRLYRPLQPKHRQPKNKLHQRTQGHRVKKATNTSHKYARTQHQRQPNQS